MSVELRALVYQELRPYFRPSNNHIRQDLEQDAWLAAFEGVEQMEVRGDAENAAYVRSCIRNRLAMHARKEGRKMRTARQLCSLDATTHGSRGAQERSFNDVWMWVGKGVVRQTVPCTRTEAGGLRPEWGFEKETLYGALSPDTESQFDVLFRNESLLRLSLVLSKDERDTLVMKLEGLSYEEMADETSVSADAHRKRLTRVIEKASKQT